MCDHTTRPTKERKEATDGKDAKAGPARQEGIWRLGEPSEVRWEEVQALELDPRGWELIRQLIPLGLAEVGRMLAEEVEDLAGRRHARKGDAGKGGTGTGITRGR